MATRIQTNGKTLKIDDDGNMTIDGKPATADDVKKQTGMDIKGNPGGGTIISGAIGGDVNISKRRR